MATLRSRTLLRVSAATWSRAVRQLPAFGGMLHLTFQLHLSSWLARFVALAACW